MGVPFFDINLPSAAWALHEPALASLMSRMDDPKALQSVLANKADRGKRLGIRDGVGILYVCGTLVKRESWLSGLLGWVSYDTLRQDLQAALEDPKISAIAFHVDSPGGEANGCDELATAIYDARKKKPTAAFVSGMACSAAYWLASAAERVVVSDAALLGSIGVAVQYVDTTAREKSRGIHKVEFVSAQSPNKRNAPARVQKMVDDMGAVFVSAVARYRGVTPATVEQRFGRGGVEIGANAVRVGMADAIGNFDGVLADLRRRPIPLNVKPLSAVKPVAQEATFRPAPAAPVVLTAGERARINAAARAEAAEIERIRAICESDIGRKRAERAAFFAFETTLSADEAISAMKQEGLTASWQTAIKNVTI